jgi:hypothetical protein
MGSFHFSPRATPGLGFGGKRTEMTVVCQSVEHDACFSLGCEIAILPIDGLRDCSWYEYLKFHSNLKFLFMTRFTHVYLILPPFLFIYRWIV